ncbi:hypothetical protein MLD52_03660 [Puniceicoccaceae bacterium K14]|nr:hypothetical protein [Puniceicoccaceae bacterium K14]
MNKTILQIGLGLFAFLFVISSCSNCSRKSTNSYGNNYNVSIQQTITQDAASGLDLKAVGELVKKVKTGEEFERSLNDPSTGINNLDLDENNQVDYINVTEYGSTDIRGFSLTVDLAAGETQEVATIEIEKTANGANVQTHGNRHLYGNNYYYRSQTSLTDVLLISWLFSSNRPFYSSPYGYGNYPNDYRSYTPRSYDNYRRDMSKTTSSSTYTPSNSSTLSKEVASPNATKTASNIKAPLKSPTTAQKSFQARNPSKQVKSGGFGKKTTSTAKSSSYSPTVRKSTTSSFRGGGK